MGIKDSNFQSSLSPLGGLTGAGLLIMASARLSWAIIISLNLFWVYILCAVSYASLSNLLGKKYFPLEGRGALLTCIAYFWSSIFIFLFWLICPLAALEIFLLLLLVPLFFTYGGLENIIPSGELDIGEYFTEAVLKASNLAILLIVFSVIREPLAFCSLSLPGTSQGMFFIFNISSFLSPIGIFSSSAGALLLLGYFIFLYQFRKEGGGF